jgi:hypothetical protein
MKKLLFILCLLPLLCSAQFNPNKYWDVAFVKGSDEDAGNSELVYSITAGNPDKYFVILPCSGVVKVDTAIYKTFVTSKTTYLTIKVADVEGNYVKTVGKVVLKKINGIKVKPTVIGL